MAVTREQVAKLYVAVFNRAPDANGLDYWLNDGTSATTTLTDVNAIAKAMQTGAEASTGVASMTDSAYVVSLYSSMFGRTISADSVDVAYWTAQMTAGNVTRANMIQTLILGAEASTGNADDAAVLANKTEVGLTFADAGLTDVAEAANVMDGVTKYAGSVTVAKAAITTLEAVVVNEAAAEASAEAQVVAQEIADSFTALTVTDSASNLANSVVSLRGADNAIVNDAATVAQLTTIDGLTTGTVTAATVTDTLTNLNGFSTSTYSTTTVNGTITGSVDASAYTLPTLTTVTFANAVNSLTLTEAQYDAVASVITATAGTTDTVVIAAGAIASITTNTGVDAYTISEDSDNALTVTIGATDNVNITSASVNDVITVQVAGTYTGTLATANAADTNVLSFTATGSIVGSTLDTNFDKLTIADGATATMTSTQHATFNGTITATGTNGITISNDTATITALAGIETYTLANGTNSLTMGTVNATTVTGGTGADTIVFDGVTAYTGTYALAAGTNVINLVNGSNIGGATITATAGTINFDIAAGGALVTMKNAAYTLLAAGTLTTATGTDQITFSDATTGQTAEAEVEKYVFANATNSFTAHANTTHLTGGTGNDTFIMGTNMDSGVTIVGGTAGTDVITMTDQTGNTTDLDNVSGVETITLGAAVTVINTVDALVGAGASLTVNATNATSLNWDGTSEADGVFIILGSSGIDTLKGGAQADTLYGAAGADSYVASNGADTVLYAAATDGNSAGAVVVANADTIAGTFNGSTDKIGIAYGGTSNFLNGLGNLDTTMNAAAVVQGALDANNDVNIAAVASAGNNFATTAEIITAMGAAIANSTTGDKSLIAVLNLAGTEYGLYYFQESATNQGTVDADELTLMGVITTGALAAGDFSAVAALA